MSGDSAVFLTGTRYNRDWQTQGPRDFVDRVAVANGAKTHIYESPADSLGGYPAPARQRLLARAHRAGVGDQLPQLLRAGHRSGAADPAHEEHRPDAGVQPAPAEAHLGDARRRHPVPGEAHASRRLSAGNAAAGHALALSVRVHRPVRLRPEPPDREHQPVRHRAAADDRVPGHPGLRGRELQSAHHRRRRAG